MRKVTSIFVAVAIVFIAAASALAHDGHVHKIMGTVTARDAKHLEVRTPSGEVLSIAITDKTKALKDKKKIDLKEVQVGRRVVVEIGNGEDPLMAGDIHLGVTSLAATESSESH